jgi:hypothetical protein
MPPPLLTQSHTPNTGRADGQSLSGGSLRAHPQQLPPKGAPLPPSRFLALSAPNPGTTHLSILVCNELPLAPIPPGQMPDLQAAARAWLLSCGFPMLHQATHPSSFFSSTLISGSWKPQEHWSLATT